MEENLKILQEWVSESTDIVVFTGPGMSVESGVPNFRIATEENLKRYGLPPQAIMSRAYMERRPAPFFRFYREQVLTLLLEAEPHAGHKKLVELEQSGRLRTVITENIDDIHQEAGSKKVLELFGSVMKNYCTHCDQKYSAMDILEKYGIPYCDVDMCGKVMRPDIVLYGEAFNEEVMTDIVYNILMADMFIVAGASLSEQAAASLACYYDRKKLVLIGDEPEHPLDQRANLILRGKVSDILGALEIPPKE